MWPSYLGVPAFHGSDKSLLSVDRCEFSLYADCASALLTPLISSVLRSKCSRLVIEEEVAEVGNEMYISWVKIYECTPHAFRQYIVCCR